MKNKKTKRSGDVKAAGGCMDDVASWGSCPGRLVTSWTWLDELLPCKLAGRRLRRVDVRDFRKNHATWKAGAELVRGLSKNVAGGAVGNCRCMGVGFWMETCTVGERTSWRARGQLAGATGLSS